MDQTQKFDVKSKLYSPPLYPTTYYVYIHTTLPYKGELCHTEVNSVYNIIDILHVWSIGNPSKHS